jgi:cytidine deaminase
VSDPVSEQALTEAAFTALEHAYAPYSEFRVGAALLGADGSVSVGCNVENSAYPVGTCAERAALAAAVVHGAREFVRLVIATEADHPTPPCGMCRQALEEFSAELDILSVTRGGATARWNLRQLLPEPFTPASLTHS